MSKNQYILDVAVYGALIQFYTTTSIDNCQKATGENWDKPIDYWGINGEFDEEEPSYKLVEDFMNNPVDLKFVDKIIEIVLPMNGIITTPQHIERFNLLEKEILQKTTTFEERLKANACTKDDIKDKKLPIFIVHDDETEDRIGSLTSYLKISQSSKYPTIYYGETVENALNKIKQLFDQTIIINRNPNND